MSTQTSTLNWWHSSLHLGQTHSHITRDSFIKYAAKAWDERLFAQFAQTDNTSLQLCHSQKKKDGKKAHHNVTFDDIFVNAYMWYCLHRFLADFISLFRASLSVVCLCKLCKQSSSNMLQKLEMRDCLHSLHRETTLSEALNRLMKSARNLCKQYHMYAFTKMSSKVTLWWAFFFILFLLWVTKLKRFSEYTPSVGEEGGSDSVNTHLLWVRRWERYSEYTPSVGEEGGRDSVNTHLSWVRRWERFSEYTPSVGEEGGRDSVNTHLLWVRRVGEIQWIHTCCVWGGGRDSVNTHLLWTGTGRAPGKAVLAVSALPNKLWHALKITHTQKQQHMTSFYFTTITHFSAQMKSEFKLKKQKMIMWNRVEESDLQDCLTYKDQRRAAQPSDKSCDRSDRPCASLFRSGLWIWSSQPACPQSIHPWEKIPG